MKYQGNRATGRERDDAFAAVETLDRGLAPVVVASAMHDARHQPDGAQAIAAASPAIQNPLAGNGHRQCVSV